MPYRQTNRYLGALMVLTLATPVLGDHFEFESEGPWATDGYPLAPYAGDFDGDGHLDLAVSSAGLLTLLLGDGTGTLSPAPPVDLASGANSVALGDFDGDGNPDLLIGSFSTTVDLLLGDGGGGFLPSLNIDLGVLYPYVTVADFDDDGNLDFAAAATSSPPGTGFVSVSLGDGLGGFAPALPLDASPTPRQPIAVDVDDDGNLDLVVPHFDFTTGPFGGGIGVLYGNGAGAFAPEVEIFPEATVAVTSSDLDGDGLPDLLAISPIFGPVCGSVATVLRNQGNGFESLQTINGVCGPHSALADDFDSDGVPDLVVTDGGDFIAAANVVDILHGVGDGTFLDQQTIGNSLFVLAPPVIGDFDEDGRPDIATAGIDSTALYFRNVTALPEAPFRRGDADASGAFNGLVDGLFLLNYQFVSGSPAPPCLDAADVDDSGGVNGLVDGLAALNFQFVPGAPPPAPPGPADCGDDPTFDLVSCELYPACP